MSKKSILEFKDISKRYDTVEALQSISFSIPENSIFGILGANGSGKSTFMKILPGLISNWSGEIYYKQELVKRDSMILKSDFGYLIESPTFYEYLSAQKNLEILSRISNVKKDRIDSVFKLVELSDRSLDKVQTYSYGMKQRLGIAQALLHNPSVIVLDEPNNGLDPNGIDGMNRIIKRLKSEGKTICLSTHNLKDVEGLCTDFTVFNYGKNSIATSMEKQLAASQLWKVRIDNPSSAMSKVEGHKSLKLLSTSNNSMYIESGAKDTVKALSLLFKEFEIYSISKESNLIEYFKND